MLCHSRLAARAQRGIQLRAPRASRVTEWHSAQRRCSSAAMRAPAKARHLWGESPRRTPTLGSETAGNCVAARRGGEQPEKAKGEIARSATEVNPIRPTEAANLRLVVKPGTEREPVAPRAQRRRRGNRGWLGAERREDGAREAGRPDRGSVTTTDKVTRSGVRAPIRVAKRRNGRGAKGGREVET